MISVSISLYGAFRQLGVNQIVLEVPERSRVADLREILEDHLKSTAVKIPASLIKASAFATDEFVLNDGDEVTGLKSVAILPPVCGG